MNQPRHFLRRAATLALLLFSGLAAQLAAAQRTVVPLPPAETFTEADRPTTYWNVPYSWEKPWGYDRPENAGRVYPLMVFGEFGGNEYFTEAIRKAYPAFYCGFYKTTEADGATLSNVIDSVMASRGFRIDLNRIYLSGFSAGGSGSYKVIRGFLSKGKCFAGLIRIAGQSESVLAEDAVNKIAISMHVGLQDDAKRISVSRALYANIRNHPANANAVETVLHSTFTPEADKFPDATTGTITTKVLTLDGVDVIRYSEYDPMDHDNVVPFTADPAIFSWIMTRAIGTPAAVYATWRAAHFTGADLTNEAISGPEADPDGCGLTNLARYAFDLPARGPVADPITVGTTTVGTDSFLTLTFPRRADASGLTYILESSTDLATWTGVEGRTYSTGTEPVTAQDTVAWGSSTRRFLRVRAAQVIPIDDTPQR